MIKFVYNCILLVLFIGINFSENWPLLFVQIEIETLSLTLEPMLVV